MSPENRILAAIDLSPCSAAALRRAIQIAAWYQAPVMGLHVIPPLTPPSRGPLGPLSPGFDLPSEDDLIQAAQRRWEQFSASIDGAASVDFAVEVGSPRDKILETVRRDKPRFLVVGAHGRCDGYLGVGPVASACAEWAATQVLIVRQRQAGPFRSIVACVDFSDTSRRALEAAMTIAAEESAALHILHAYVDPWHGLGPTDDIRRNMPDFAAHYSRAMEDRLREFCAPFATEFNSIKPAFHVVRAKSHGEAINAFIAERGCDLAVLGSRAKFNLRDYFWGSTAERVVRDASCSVLVVKPAGFAEREPYQRFEDSPALESAS
jgi:nucleotide-binding universal stress UspA family protein